MELEGKRILLSGASGGLGRAIAERLADAGAKLVLSSRRKPELTELARSLPGGGRRHKVIVADLAKAKAAAKLVAEAGELDGLVANAALPASGKLDELSETEITRALRVNLEAPVLMARALGPRLASKGEGHLVMIASLSGKVGTPRASLYSATKFGLRGFCFGFREDMHPHGVGVSIVSPGFVSDAGMFHDSGARAPLSMGTTTPKKVARAVEKVIRKNKLEIVVAPRRLRVTSEFGYRHPRAAAAIQRRAGADEIAGAVADGQREKR